MSMNIRIYAERQGTFVTEDGRSFPSTDRQFFQVSQTPTSVTMEIMRSETPVEAYVDWIKSNSEVEQVPVYDPNADWDAEPTHWVPYIWGDEHINQLREWVKSHQEQGYQIHVDMI